MKRLALFLSTPFLVLALVSAMASQTLHFETSVPPLVNEDIAAACHAAITIPAPEHSVDAVWVIYDRGRDVHDLYADPSVISFARRLHLALLLHGHCPGKQVEDRGDMNMDPANGLGRVLFAALSQFAEASGHRIIRSSR